MLIVTVLVIILMYCAYNVLNKKKSTRKKVRYIHVKPPKSIDTYTTTPMLPLPRTLTGTQSRHTEIITNTHRREYDGNGRGPIVERMYPQNEEDDDGGYVGFRRIDIPFIITTTANVLNRPMPLNGPELIMRDFLTFFPIDGDDIGIAVDNTQNSHNPSVVDGIKEMTERILALRAGGGVKYNPNYDCVPEYLEYVRGKPELAQRHMEAIEKACAGDKFETKMMAYHDLSPHQMLNLIYQQAKYHLIYGNENQEMFDNIMENLAIGLSDAVKNDACAMGLFNRIAVSAETYNLDGVDTTITTDVYIKEVILAGIARKREDMMEQEKIIGDPTGFYAWSIGSGASDTSDEMSLAMKQRMELMKAEIEQYCDKEYGNMRYYRKNKDMLMENLFE